MAEKQYIEREAAIANRREYNLGGSYDNTELAVPVDAINSIPAAAVRPVVLCKDCVYSDKWYADRLICYLWNEHDGNSVFEDGFCNYGVKREES